MYNPKGFKAEEVKKYKAENKSLRGFSDKFEVEKEECYKPWTFLEQPCDILIPASVEKEIN